MIDLCKHATPTQEGWEQIEDQFLLSCSNPHRQSHSGRNLLNVTIHGSTTKKPKLGTQRHNFHQSIEKPPSLQHTGWEIWLGSERLSNLIRSDTETRLAFNRRFIDIITPDPDEDTLTNYFHSKGLAFFTSPDRPGQPHTKKPKWSVPPIQMDPSFTPKKPRSILPPKKPHQMTTKQPDWEPPCKRTRFSQPATHEKKSCSFNENPTDLHHRETTKTPCWRQRANNLSPKRSPAEPKKPTSNHSKDRWFGDPSTVSTKKTQPRPPNDRRGSSTPWSNQLPPTGTIKPTSISEFR